MLFIFKRDCNVWRCSIDFVNDNNNNIDDNNNYDAFYIPKNSPNNMS